MSINPELIKSALLVIGEAGQKIAKDKDAQKIILGKYSNGKPRSVIDAINGEIIDPKDKLLITKRLEDEKKNKKKKKKKKKNKNKKAQSYWV